MAGQGVRHARVEIDRDADAAYVSLTDAPLPAGRTSIECAAPGGNGTVVLDFADGRLVGVEVVGAAALLGG